jgi:hypothetical protein
MIKLGDLDMTLLDEIQQKITTLPLEKQSEVLEFIEFLQYRKQWQEPKLLQEKKKRIQNTFKKITLLNMFTEITDPVAWQKQVRQDRLQPGRTS